MKNKEYRARLARQGDILILPVDKIPGRTRKLKPADRYIVAEGEATGHHHAVVHADGLEVHQRGEDRFWLNIGDSAAVLEHPEHATVTLDPGTYEVRRQREYNPDGLDTRSQQVYD